MSDVDALTSGIKKMNIKLNVPSKEEHDRRMAEKTAAAKTRNSAAPSQERPRNGVPSGVYKHIQPKPKQVEAETLLPQAAKATDPLQDTVIPRASMKPSAPSVSEPFRPRDQGPDPPFNAEPTAKLEPEGKTTLPSPPCDMTASLDGRRLPHTPTKHAALFSPGSPIVFAAEAPVNDENRHPSAHIAPETQSTTDTNEQAETFNMSHTMQEEG